MTDADNDKNHVITNINDIPGFNKSNVYLKNTEELLPKVNKIIQDGTKKLQIVSDFDKTLTRHHEDDGTAVKTTFDMFWKCPSIPQRYKDGDKKLSAEYRPIEKNPNMSVEEKTKHMVDWYEKAHENLKGVKFPREELNAVAKTMVSSFRKGVKDLLEWTKEKEVPVLIFSAGIGECVLVLLTAANLHLSNIEVISNFLEMDEHDVVAGMKYGNPLCKDATMIHTLNKNETAIKGTKHYEKVKGRSNVIVMGDNIGDAGMAEGMEHCDVVIKIGFIGKDNEDNLQSFLTKFDIVLVDEHSVDIVNALLKLVR